MIIVLHEWEKFFYRILQKFTPTWYLQKFFGYDKAQIKREAKKNDSTDSNDKYLSLQSEKIKERIAKFGGKLYLEFGGKLFDDYHASRVLPGFHPDSKINMLAQLKDEAEIVIVINAADIEKNKVRSDLVHC